MSDNEQVIKDFIEETPTWLKSIKKQNDLSGLSGCPYCGIDEYKIELLLKVIIELQEKAWKYDELSR
jgi:hypothetical protein